LFDSGGSSLYTIACSTTGEIVYGTNFASEDFYKSTNFGKTGDLKIIEYLKNNKHLFKESITFPDALVYCGIKPVIGNIQDIEKYYNNYKEIPKIFIDNKRNLLFGEKYLDFS